MSNPRTSKTEPRQTIKPVWLGPFGLLSFLFTSIIAIALGMMAMGTLDKIVNPDLKSLAMVIVMVAVGICAVVFGATLLIVDAIMSPRTVTSPPANSTTTEG